MRDDKLELDVKILAKNLEITKLTTKIDSLTTKLVRLKDKYDQLFNDHSIKIKTDE
tara:strand:+ start:318 stop:485 length:168 start_codon:yes stop_codon:yes gene_type:complete